MIDNTGNDNMMDVSETSDTLDEYAKNRNVNENTGWIFTLFALDENNDVIGERAVIAEDCLLQTIKEMFEDEGVTHVEVHEGTCRY